MVGVVENLEVRIFVSLLYEGVKICPSSYVLAQDQVPKVHNQPESSQHERPVAGM